MRCRRVPLRFVSLMAVFPVLLAAGCSHSSGGPGNASAPAAGGPSRAVSLLNVSYGPTRELYKEYDAAFRTYWQGKAGQTVTAKETFGGSGKQARTVIDGLEADVVTLADAQDVDEIQRAGLINAGWAQRLPNNSCPYTSTVVFLVRKGNPKGIHDWPDLVKPGVGMIAPNPKTGGGARWNYLAAWGYALQASHGDQNFARDFVSKLYHNAVKLDSGQRESTQSFTQQGLGDFFLCWENEAMLISRQLYPGQYEIVYPSVSILGEPPVAVVDRNADAHGTRAAAEEYLKYLYSPEGQEIVAKHFYRPTDPTVAKKYASQFPPVKLFTIETVFGGWDQAQKTHFADGAIFDQIYRK